jgi:hypothetical protein
MVEYFPKGATSTSFPALPIGRYTSYAVEKAQLRELSNKLRIEERSAKDARREALTCVRMYIYILRYMLLPIQVS